MKIYVVGGSIGTSGDFFGLWQSTLGSWPVNFETLSMDNTQGLNSSELCLVQVFKYVIYLSMELC